MQTPESVPAVQVAFLAAVSLTPGFSPVFDAQRRQQPFQRLFFRALEAAEAAETFHGQESPG